MIVLQHAASEDLGTIENALRREAIEFRYVRTFECQPVPKDPDAFSALIAYRTQEETGKVGFLRNEVRENVTIREP